jgi:hypothetical protein
MSTRSVTASHPDYERLNELTMMLVHARNAGMIFIPRGEHGEIYPPDLKPLELASIICMIEADLEKELEGGAFSDYINARDWNIDTRT